MGRWRRRNDSYLYVKAMNGKTIIRKERQEYLNVTFEQAMEEKLSIVQT